MKILEQYKLESRLYHIIFTALLDSKEFEDVGVIKDLTWQILDALIKAEKLTI